MNIVITGGGSGIGAAIAQGLDKEHSSIIICGRRLLKLKETAKVSKQIKYFKCDVSSENEVLLFRDFVEANFTHLDVIINCAGFQGAIGRFYKTDSALWKKTFEVNTFGIYLITKHFLPLLLKSKKKKIINFSGGGAFNTFPNYSAYAVSKAAVVRFSENIAAELTDLGVQVNCIAPGFVATEIHDATLAEGEEFAGENYNFTVNKLKKGSVPIEVVVNCVKFLISNKSNRLSGKTISASFDKWDTEEFENSIGIINDSELFTMRRLNLVNLNENDPLREII